MGRLSMFTGVALVGAAVAGGAHEQAIFHQDCAVTELCPPLPVSLGDKPARDDAPLGPTGPRLPIGASLTGATGASSS
jgi:hypothetical protein